jgi:poly-beta-hydroxyalkanoate depolymerase
MDIDDMVKEIEQNIEWFCDKVVEPVPLNKQDKDKIMKRMINLGWLRQSEYETYNEATKED